MTTQKSIIKFEKKESDAPLLFVEGLDSTPGWVVLPYDKQKQIVEHTSHVQRFRQMQRLGEFGELVELTQVHQILEGEDMEMKNFLRVVYPDHSERTIYRKLQVFQEVSTHIPNSVLKKIGGLNEEVLTNFENITTAPIGEIRRVLKQMPMLPLTTDKAAEQYLAEVNEKLSHDRRKRAKGKRVDDDFAAKMATNGVLHYMKQTKLTTSAEKRQFLKRVFGWIMEAQAIPGTISTTRLAIPEGLLIRRGRPRSKPRKEAA